MRIAETLSAFFATLPPFRPGHVWLAGAGPGDPGLLTLHAAAALGAADVVVHDALVDPRVLALARPEARLELAGKRGHQPSTAQDEISERLVELAGRNERVLRLKGGDPLIFGRVADEMLALAEHRIPFRVIPGVTAGLAGLAAAMIPATIRGVNQAVIVATGHGADAETRLDWAALARTGQPLLLYMAMHDLDFIAGALIAGGLAPATPAAVIASATMEGERILVARLDRIADEARRAEIGAPAVVAIGEIVAFRGRLDAMLAALATEALP